MGLKQNVTELIKEVKKLTFLVFYRIFGHKLYISHNLNFSYLVQDVSLSLLFCIRISDDKYIKLRLKIYEI